MKLSARNVLKGRVVDIDKGKVTAIVRVDIGGDTVITSSITWLHSKTSNSGKAQTFTLSSKPAKYFWAWMANPRRRHLHSAERSRPASYVTQHGNHTCIHPITG